MVKRNGIELTSGIVTLVLTAAAVVLFCLSYTTGYYIFGQMNSGLITLLLASAVVVELAALFLRGKFPQAMWPKLLTFGVTALLAAAAMLLIGDRVEGIGNCIVTDYDSGHGGEEAIYMSLASAILMLAGVVYNIIGSFARDKAEESSKGAKVARSTGFGVSALAVLLAVLIPTSGLVRGNGGPGGNAPGGSGGAGTYTVSYNANNGNATDMPSYQFLCSDFSGMVNADSRFFVDETLELDGNGNYTLFVDSYVVEGGARAVIGDDTGLGLVLTMNAEGTYVDNGDGTYTTSVPTHAVFEMQTDTYSAQMKGAVQMNVNGNDADGVYDSDDEPAVLDFVPETVWTLADGAIVKYRNASAGGTYTVSYNANNGNAADMPDYQFLCGDFSGLVNADSRFFVDETLELDGSNYTLFVDAYVVEGGARAVIGDDTGLGLVLTMNATGTYTDNGDGTYTTSVPTHAVFEMQTDTYSAQMKGAVQMNVNGNDADGVYDSDDEPAVLDFVPETVWTLADGAIVTYYNPAEQGEGQGDQPAPADALVVPSDDGATTFTFNPDGTYVFAFEAYGIEDAGTWTYENGVLTITDANGATTTAEGEELAFTYTYSQNDQLTGNFTVSAADLEALLSGGSDAAQSVTVPSEDEATSFTFNADGTYVFAFEAYGIEDAGTWTYENGVLTIVDANGATTTAEGEELAFTYTYSQNDQLTGNFTVSAADLSFTGGEEAKSVTVPSEDEATTFTFNADGTYVFAFEAYGIEDAGTWAYNDGVLTIVDANGATTTAEGEELAFTYTYSQNDQLTGNFTVSAAELNFAGGEVTVTSDDGGTTMTFSSGGTYVFAFEAYGIEEPGTWAYEGGKLSVTNSVGAVAEAEGDPLVVHYVSGVSDQLTGDFTIPVSELPD